MHAVQKFHHPKVLKEQEVTTPLQMDIREIIINHSTGDAFPFFPSKECEELIVRGQEQQSATELLSLGSRPPVEVVSVEEGEEVDQMAGSPSVQSRSPVTAPLGISMNFGSRKALSNAFLCNNHLKRTCLNSCELPDTRSLRKSAGTEVGDGGR
ncbi:TRANSCRIPTIONAL ADAPTER 1 [Salix koriyanagi]|uniref:TRANSCRIPTIONAL ADAPTER 1 n=1 Tax=Salix koriyanagi TaxID=2511006 RepID=A0A9Q0TRW1_9ROSI|nr:TRANSCRIPTIONAL ADAPTER 1 [Salix koriyanagi]